MSTRSWIILGAAIWALSVALAFGLGRLSIEKGEKTPIIIEKISG